MITLSPTPTHPYSSLPQATLQEDDISTEARLSQLKLQNGPTGAMAAEVYNLVGARLGKVGDIRYADQIRASTCNVWRASS